MFSVLQVPGFWWGRLPGGRKPQEKMGCGSIQKEVAETALNLASGRRARPWSLVGSGEIRSPLGAEGLKPDLKDARGEGLWGRTRR